MRVLSALLTALLMLGVLLPARAEKTGTKPAPPIPIVLTFDDGPQTSRNPATNDTLRILRTLKQNKTKSGIVGAFFVQTHAGRMNDNPNSPGTATMLSCYKAGNVIGVHTGSKGDHVPHTIRVRQPAGDGNGDGVITPEDGSSGLASDLIQARRRVCTLTGADTHYVRAVGGATNSKVFHTYSAQGWKYIRWNVDSRDNIPPRPSASQIQKNLHSGITLAIRGWHKPALIILFHDINSRTATHLDEYIAAIDKAVRKNGRTPQFTTSRAEVEKVFEENAEPLTHSRR